MLDLAIDFIIDLPAAKLPDGSYINIILIVIDYFIKIAFYIPTTIKLNTK